MRISLFLLRFVLPVAQLAAQTVSAPAPNPSSAVAASPNPGGTSMTSILPDLDRLQAAASQATLDIGRMRIEKWKADGESKRQAQSNADSVQRNLTTALPGLIEAARSSPQDLTAEFKLYRNLNALYDVMGTLTEAAGAFGPKSDYEALTEQFQAFASVRRSLGDALEQLTASTQSELTQLRNQIRAQQTAAAAATASLPKKVVVDDTEPPPKAAHKKKKPAAADGTSGSSPSSSNEAGSGTSVPKS